jgi:hypothetical protein
MKAVQISFALGRVLPVLLRQMPLCHELIHDVFADFRYVFDGYHDGFLSREKP